MSNPLTPLAVMAEVDRIMSAHWQWGAADCCTGASDVFAALHGFDPMAPVRGQYDTALSAYRLIREWGGFAAMAQSLADIAGLRASDGLPGDIGLSPVGATEGPERRALLICIQPGAWAGKTDTGFAILPTAERCWRA